MEADCLETSFLFIRNGFEEYVSEESCRVR